MDNNIYVSLRNKSGLPDFFLKIVFDYEPTSKVILLQEEKVQHEAKIDELQDIIVRLVLARDTEGLQKLQESLNKSQHYGGFLTSFFTEPRYYFNEVNEEVRECLSYVAKNSNMIRNLSSLDYLKGWVEGLKYKASPSLDNDRKWYLNFLELLNNDPYKNFIESELGSDLKFLHEKFRQVVNISE